MQSNILTDFISNILFHNMRLYAQLMQNLHSEMVPSDVLDLAPLQDSCSKHNL